MWDFAIDAGSENMRLCSLAEAELFRESSLVARHVEKDLPFAWGNRAQVIYGREPEGVCIQRAVRQGLPADAALLAKWVCRLVEAHEGHVPRRNLVLMAVSPEIRPDVLREVHARIAESDVADAEFIASDIACALGAGEDVMDARGTMIVDVGAEHVTASMLSGGRCVCTQSLHFGMNRVDERLMQVVREELGCAVGPHVARELVLEMSAAEGLSGEVVSVKPAFDYKTMLPRMVEFSSALLRPCVKEVTEAVREILAHMVRFLPVGLAADLTEHGIVLAGGGAGLFGFDRLLERALELPVRAAEEPQECVIRGLYRMMQEPEIYRLLVMDVLAEGSKV